MMDVHAIARRYGGKVCKGNALIPTPGHSSRDRGTAIKPCASAPDGVLVACYNGDRTDALAVKDILRADGFLTDNPQTSRTRKLTPAELQSIRQAESARKRERLKAEEAAAQYVRETWNSASLADQAHPYLVAKGLDPFGVRQAGNALLVPMVDATFRLWNVQRIKPDGFMLFAKGARTSGLFWPHAMHLSDGRPSPGPLVIGEGFATLAAIHEATSYAVTAAMSARNLEPVAHAMRGLFPARQIIIAADNDQHLAENIGLRVARRAAELIGGLLAVPTPKTPPSNSGADFADLARDQTAATIAATLKGEV